jgi:hypothetical protein
MEEWQGHLAEGIQNRDVVAASVGKCSVTDRMSSKRADPSVECLSLMGCDEHSYSVIRHCGVMSLLA